MLAPGQRIDPYELACPIGDGALAHVWAARRRGAHEDLVALKIIRPRIANDPTFRQMLRDDARVASAIQHRNVARVLELGESGSLLYLVLEYVDGDALHGLVAPNKKVPAPIALRIAADVCAGLCAVYATRGAGAQPHDVVHGDVAPENVLLDARGDVKLIAVGARARDHAVNAGAAKRKVPYMAPEQARRERPGPRTDVFGVGALLCRMIEGAAPYDAGSDAATIEALLAGRPPRAPLSPDVPESIATVAARAIAPSATDRYPDVGVLGQALEALLAREPRPDVAGWMSANLSHEARERRARLGLAPARGRGRAPAPADERPDPGFMDIGALMASARSPATEPRPVEPTVRSPEGGAPASPPQETSRATMAAPAVHRAGKGAFKLAIAAIVLVLVMVVGLLLAPTIVRRRALSAAREAGVSMTIEAVGVGFDGIRLRGVVVEVPRAPGITASAAEIHLTGLSQREARVHGLDLRLRGAPEDLERELSALAAKAQARFAGRPSAPRHLSIVGARMTWESGAGERVEASDVGVELDSRGAGVEDLRGSAGRVLARSSTSSYGPWAGAFERSEAKARVHVMFDPTVPDGPSALVVWTKAGGTEVTDVTVKVPRSSFGHLHLSPEELGIPADAATDVEVSVVGTLSPATRSTVTFDATLFGARPKGLSGPIDVHVEGAAIRVGERPFELDKTTVAIGPFVAGVSGTLTPHERGARLDARFKTLPTPCERLARDQAKAMGTLAATLQALGQRTGALRVTGAVDVSGIVTYDTAQPKEASVTWLAKESCGVSIFGM